MNSARIVRVSTTRRPYDVSKIWPASRSMLINA